MLDVLPTVLVCLFVSIGVFRVLLAGVRVTGLFERVEPEVVCIDDGLLDPPFMLDTVMFVALLVGQLWVCVGWMYKRPERRCTQE